MRNSCEILYADCHLQAILVFVRLAHDQRFVGAVLLFVLVLFVFIRISGRHRVAHDHEGTPVGQPLGDVWVMSLLLGCGSVTISFSACRMTATVDASYFCFSSVIVVALNCWARLRVIL